MNFFKKILYHWFFSKIAKKICPNSIPRSGLAGKQINCISVYIIEDKKYYLLEGYLKELKTLKCLIYNGEKFENKINIPIDNTYDLEIRQFYGLDEILFNGLNDFLFQYVFRIKYIKINIDRAYIRIIRFFFNKKNLVVIDRIELLKLIVEIYLKRNIDITLIGLMIKKYSLNWFYHPQKELLKKKVQFNLDSLLFSGDLVLKSNGYSPTGKAVITIDEFEKEEFKDSRFFKLQRSMRFLTFLLVLVGLLQSEIINIPTLLDLNNFVEYLRNFIEYTFN